MPQGVHTIRARTLGFAGFIAARTTRVEELLHFTGTSFDESEAQTSRIIEALAEALPANAAELTFAAHDAIEVEPLNSAGADLEPLAEAMRDVVRSVHDPASGTDLPLVTIDGRRVRVEAAALR
jgi:hypothetical protein